ncbi:hypothetical protein Vafri_14772 [Volvox africanus]|uniref:Uncharacterized protein n=1 Tax=Volvox africanus TaxID=51714 RepID=A0A8J4BJP0_9CHLO|nr:hypothetical protein Vafri_14772 [Volvox africanus]
MDYNPTITSTQGPSASSPHAARPETPAAVEARKIDRSPNFASVSRSADLTSLKMGAMAITFLRSARTCTAPNFVLPEFEQLAQHSSSGAGTSMMPQPPAIDSPGISSTSPRIRSFSSRSLPSRASLSVSQLLDNEAVEASELCLSQSPRLMSTPGNGPMTPEPAPPAPAGTSAAVEAQSPSHRRGASTASPQSTASHRSPRGARLPIAASPAGRPHRGESSSPTNVDAKRAQITDRPNDTESPNSGAETAAAPLLTGSASAKDTDPWAALRAHCMEVYGKNLISDGEDSEEDLGEYGTGPGRLMLMRHPSLITHRLTHTFGERSVSPRGSAVSASSPPSNRRSNSSDNAKRAAVAAADAAAAAAAPTAAARITALTGQSAVKLAGMMAPPPPHSQTAAEAISVAAAAADGPSVAPLMAAAVEARLRAAAVAVSGAAQDVADPANCRARQVMAGAATVPAEAPPPLRRPSVSLFPASVAGVLAAPPIGAPTPTRSESGTSSTSSAAAAEGLMMGSSAMQGRYGITGGGDDRGPLFGATAAANAAASVTFPSQHPPVSGGGRQLFQRQQAVRSAVRSTAAASALTSVFEGSGSFEEGAAAEGTSFEVQLQHLIVLAPLDPGGSGGGSVGTTDRRVSESGGGGAVMAGSILDVASLNTDPVHKWRLSADGLNRHASKYGGGGIGGGDGAAAISAVTSPGAVDDTATAGRSGMGGPEMSPSGGGGGGRAIATTAHPVSPSMSQNPMSSSPSAMSGRAPLITALAFERAPWCHPSSSAAAAGHGAGSVSGVPAPPVLTLSGSAKPTRPSGLAAAVTAPLPRLSGFPIGKMPQRGQLGIGQAVSVGVSAPVERVADVAASTAATAVDKLRGYKSSKVLLGATTLSSNNPPAAHPAGATIALPAANPSAAAVRGLSSPVPRRQLGSFASMRSLCRPSAAASFLERLSGSCGLTGNGGRVSGRRTIGGGGAAAAASTGDWTADGSRSRSFRRREGSYSLDGSGCQVPGVERGPFAPQLGGEGSLGDAGGTAAPASGWSAAVRANLESIRNLKKVLPRSPNGLPLAWSAIEEDGREGSEEQMEAGGDRDRDGDGDDDDDGGGDDGGGGGEGNAAGLGGREACSRDASDGGSGEVVRADAEGDREENAGKDDANEEEEEEEEDGKDEEDGFARALRAARGGGCWIDLHQTC